MFHKVVDGEVGMVVVVSVNDILTYAKRQATMERFDAELGRNFKLKGMGDAKYYMGCHVTWHHKARELKLDQHIYVKSMVKTFGVEKASKISFSTGVPSLSKADEPKTPEEKEEV